MLRQWRFATLAWNLVFFGGDVYALVSWFVPNEGLMVPLNIGAPEYALMVVLCTGGLIWVNRRWIQRLNKRGRLRSLSPLLVRIYKTATIPDVAVEFQHYVAQLPRLVTELNYRLQDLGVPMIRDDEAGWLHWICELNGCAKTKNIKRARQLRDVITGEE